MTKEVAHHKTIPTEVNSWIDQWVLLKYLTGPNLSGEDVDEIVRGNAEVRSGLFYLAEISDIGIFVAREPSTDLEDYGAFIPWSSVLVMVGPTQNVESDGENQQEEVEDRET